MIFFKAHIQVMRGVMQGSVEWSGVEWMDKVSEGALDIIRGRTYLVRDDGDEDDEPRVLLNVFSIYLD